ncbi:unnamed protein product [Rotaria socialis]|uniref:Uncharacterized protein n=1 Tax=Rotaria socialis TaxID=392032 RepID=A0A820WM50_9BILA|nr:unnamed protein product [Rotaria socialis]CAF3425207.1 unnamed protein product [Rotaria socialis]CAF4196967.1 unnamed protein product [Rotaria socialis]CAF4518475.1 unnamed protein product [Rotaria socialis]
MNPSITIALLIGVALMAMFINPIQSESMRSKRWTFNTWRLHGGRYASHTTSLNPNIVPHYSTIFADVNDQDQLLNVDNDNDDPTIKILTRQLRFCQLLDLAHKKDDYSD